MKSITINPERSLILICLEISSAASKLVFKAVFSMLDSFNSVFTNDGSSDLIACHVELNKIPDKIKTIYEYLP